MKETGEHCRRLRILVINISNAEKYYIVQLMHCLAHARRHFVILNSEVLPLTQWYACCARVSHHILQ